MLVLNTLLVVEEVPRDPDSVNAFPKGFFFFSPNSVHIKMRGGGGGYRPSRIFPTASQTKEKVTKAI